MPYKPGDLCRLESHYGVLVVVHDRCDQYRDGRGHQRRHRTGREAVKARRRLVDVLETEVVAGLILGLYLAGCIVFPLAFAILSMVIVALWIAVGGVVWIVAQRERTRDRRKHAEAGVVEKRLREAWAGDVR